MANKFNWDPKLVASHEALRAKLDMAIQVIATRPQLNAQEFEQLRVVSAFVHEYDTWQVEARKALATITERSE